MKKILVLFLTVVMLFTLGTIAAFATEADAGEAVAEASYVAQVGTTKYETIDEAIANWTSGTTLTLLSDVTLSDVITISSTENHILNLGTYTMTAASSKNAIQIVCNNTSFETDDIFKIDNLKLIESTEWLGFRGNAGTGNAVRKYNNCTAETSRITDLGDKTTGYDSTYDRLCTMYYSANKNRASVTIAIYEMTGATPRLVCIYKMAESTGKQINGAEKSLQSILKNGEKYTAKVFAWDSVSGLSPIVPADTLTFTYTAPTSTT